MKKGIKLIVGVVIIALIAVVAVKGKEYYENRYTGTYYYTMIPMDEPMELEDMKDDKGEVVGLGKKYKLKSYDEKSERLLEFSVNTEDKDKLFKPGTFLKIKASNEIVLGEEIISRDEVPEGILEKIEESK